MVVDSHPKGLETDECQVFLGGTELLIRKGSHDHWQWELCRTANKPASPPSITRAQVGGLSVTPSVHKAMGMQGKEQV